MTNHSHTNDEEAFRTAYLISGYIRQRLTPEEHTELDRWVEKSDHNMLLFEQLTDEHYLGQSLKFLEQVDTEQALQKVLSKIAAAPVKKPTLFSRLKHYTVAASVLLITGAAIVIYQFAFKDSIHQEAIYAEADIQPGSHKATLILADGKTISLNDHQKGKVATQDHTSIEKNDSGSIIYQQQSGIAPTANLYNILKTPNGGQFQLVLPDGSKAWLNAASSIRYPVAFPSGERVVEITGEIFFQIVRNKNAPFKVKLKNEMITVLGTSFNVNSYQDEPFMQTTLVEGLVSINGDGRDIQLLPGQAAKWKDLANVSVDAVSIEEITAWKEGLFVFENATIETIMRQVARWYDVQVKFEDSINHHFNAALPRNLPVSKLLRLLELTHRVQFKISGKTITVHK